MASKNPATDIAQILSDTTQRQAAAADPQTTVWVSANAGTGKTHVLTMRTLRLMLAGTPPERILCLTYTKAAAAEMSDRVFKALAKWVTSNDDDLDAALKTLLQRPPTQEERDRARTLFAFAIETPGGLKVQTIHAFCERLLQRFPLEAGVPPGFSILDDDTVRTLQREAIEKALKEATSDPESAIGRALITTVAHASDDRFDELLSQAISQRSYLKSVELFQGGQNESSDSANDIDELLRDTLSVRRTISASEIDTELCAQLHDDEIRRLIDALATSDKKSDADQAARLRQAIAVPAGNNRTDHLSDFFLTTARTPRARLMTKAVKDAHPDLDLIAARAQDRFSTLINERIALNAVDATCALITLASAVLQAYTDAKARRAGLDYEDLIEKTATLLATSDNADWVLYKLDGGLDHILVDESQDTSPAQWQIIEALAREFFSGSGAREDHRTLFAVGDEKQSIYSFQGAAPEQFSTMGNRFEAFAVEAERPWRRVPLNLSFRTVPPVLEAVDHVFSDPERTSGLGLDGDRISHVAARSGRGGLIEVWPSQKPDESDAQDVWSTDDTGNNRSAALILADKIATTIERWLDDGERLVSEDRPIRESDILILVRKRNPFAGPMVAALKARGIAVAGADRVNLIEQIAVQDLVALGDFLTLPEDDLALACVLKSPMFGFDDDDLFNIANARRATLWKAVLDARARKGKFEVAAQTLLHWRKRADFLPPFEFYSDILDAGGMREKMLSRLGTEAAEPLDEFLNLMISFDEGAPPSMSGFLTWLRAGKREIKRDMDQGTNEVRVMTVHGSKGLEAPIVFLPDTCTSSSGGANNAGLTKLDAPNLPSGMQDLMIWKIKGSGSLDAVKSAGERQKRADHDERNRLLYVAMTRARDRLYVCGFEGRKGRDTGCWHDIISEALAPVAQNISGPDGHPILQIKAPQTFDTPDEPKHALTTIQTAQSRPDWASRPAPVETELAIPFAPSKLAPYDIDDEGEPAAGVSRREDDKPGARHDIADQGAQVPLEPPGQPMRVAEDERRFLRGTLTHALLEHLPGINISARAKAANAYVDARGAILSKRVRNSIVKETLAILDHADFGVLFGKNSQAEVAIGAQVERPDGTGPPLRLSGMIDRLAVFDHEVVIIDYKTNRPAPEKVENVAEAYLYQLAAYRLALNEIYSEKTIRAAILWTQTAQLMEVPESVLLHYGTKLWQLAAPNS